MVEARFAGDGPALVDYFEGAENRMYLSHQRLGQLGLRVGDVAAYLESLPFVAHVFTAGEVRRAQAELGVPPPRSADGR